MMRQDGHFSGRPALHKKNVSHSKRMGARRTSIGGSHVDPNETSSLLDLTRLEKTQSTKHQKSIALRRSVNVAISTILSIIATIICYRAIVSYFDYMPIKMIFSSIFFILTYHATTSLSKLILGNIFSLHDSARKDPKPAISLRSDTQIAILYPVYNEDPSRVVGSILATWEQMRSIEGATAHYEFFVLSDSRPFLKRVCEEKAVMEARKLAPDLRLTYRWRSINSNAKLGNVMDFLRRFASDYKYMVVMDADSLMSGKSIHDLALICEGDEKIGIIQTNPIPILRTSIFGRMLQFSCQLYGAPFFKAIKHYYLTDSFYIGHNAIIKIEPFVKYCILPKLTGTPPWGGKPISHDLVEAALMAKHGFDVWFLPEIEGSYEEIPSNIIAFLIRERRWMQGNIQNIRVAWGFGLKHIHRDLLMSGFMAYFSSIFWSLFVMIMTLMQMGFESGREMHAPPLQVEFGTQYLLVFSATLLFLPRLIGISYCIIKRSFVFHGGIIAVLVSCILDTIFSALFAPIVMIFIVRFFLMYLKSIPVKWGSQDRDDDLIPWKICLKNFSIPMLFGVVLLILYMPLNMEGLISNRHLVASFIPNLSMDDRLLWVSPMIFSLTLSPAICRVTSSSLASFLQKKLFVTKEEVQVPEIIMFMYKFTDLIERSLSSLTSDAEAIRYAYGDEEFCRHHIHYTFSRPSRLKENSRADKENTFMNSFYNREDYLYLCNERKTKVKNREIAKSINKYLHLKTQPIK